MLSKQFFSRDACTVARALLGKVIRRRYQGHWLAAQIIETEAYYLHDRASHSSRGKTCKRQAMFMPAGTIYMYYARGKDSLNVSVKGEGNAVLIKSATPYTDKLSPEANIEIMQNLNPTRQGDRRPLNKLCAGQTLLCQALDLQVTEWDQQQFQADVFYIENIHYRPRQIIQTTRLGIPQGRDEHLPYRFIDARYLKFCTRNPYSGQQITE